jgi:hypothetical protein
MNHRSWRTAHEAAMRIQQFLLINFVTVVAAFPAWGRDPADPSASVPPAGYAPVTSGTKSYRPVQPAPWGNVNRGVTPPEKGKAVPEPKRKSPTQHGQH